MQGEQRREWLYGEIGEDAGATRMLHDGRFKLIYYATGNRRQLFDLAEDPREERDLAPQAEHAATLQHLTELLVSQLNGGDAEWLHDGRLAGLPERRFVPGPNKGLSSQRGDHWPPPPKTDLPQIRWRHEAEQV